RVYACQADNSTSCDPKPLTHTWTVDTSPPETAITVFPDRLTPSKFTFTSNKPGSRFMCLVDGGGWRECGADASFPLPDGVHSLVVMAVDPSGRSDLTPARHSWEVSMLDTFVDYCPTGTLLPPSHAVRVTMEVAYNSLPCPPAMSCRLNYTLARESASEAAGCPAVNPGVPAPAPWPAMNPPEPTPTPAESSRFVSASCVEEWANCSTGRIVVLDNDQGSCLKVETLHGEMLHDHGTLLLKDLLPGMYNLTLEAGDGFGRVDRSPVLCAFEVAEAGGPKQNLQVGFVRHPPELIEQPRAGACVEFDLFPVVGNSGGGAAPGPGAAAAGRLSYMLGGSGMVAAQSPWEWKDVPVVGAGDWAALMWNCSSKIGDGAWPGGRGGLGGAGNGSVWGLRLEGLGNGEYALQVRDNVEGSTAVYTWEVDTEVPTITMIEVPQSPSHGTSATFGLLCSKRNCRLEFNLDGGAWQVAGVGDPAGAGGGGEDDDQEGLSHMDNHVYIAPSPMPTVPQTNSYGEGQDKGSASDNGYSSSREEEDDEGVG
ncbi:unnamed protein product, partial [Discosporangium mesarthrocarpum]